MDSTHKNKAQRAAPWIAVFIVLIAFFVLDAGALAWSASLADGRQLAAEIFTFFVVLTGGAITVWKMKID